MAKLAEMDTSHSESGEGALSAEQGAELHAEIPTWTIVGRDGVQRLERSLGFPDFASALAFTNEVSFVAEEQDPHPHITTEWGAVTVVWWTHEVGGPHGSDFACAAKTGEIYVTQTLSDVS